MTLLLEVSHGSTWASKPSSECLRSSDSTWSGVRTLDGSSWLEAAIEVLNEMAGYKPNWDSYGSPPIHREALENAAWLLLYFHSVNRSSEVVPHVGPVSGGGIQIDWDTKDRSLELEIYPDGRLEYLATAQNQESCSGLIADIEQLAELLSWVSRT